MVGGVLLQTSTQMEMLRTPTSQFSPETPKFIGFQVETVTAGPDLPLQMDGVDGRRIENAKGRLAERVGFEPRSLVDNT